MYFGICSVPKVAIQIYDKVPQDKYPKIGNFRIVENKNILVKKTCVE